jgi:hypothetical protein
MTSKSLIADGRAVNLTEKFVPETDRRAPLIVTSAISPVRIK